MDELYARIQRLRWRHPQQRSRQGAVAKENAHAGKRRSKATVASSSTLRSAAALVKAWTGDQGQRVPYGTMGAVPPASDFTHLHAPSPPLAVPAPCSVSCKRDARGNPFAPVTPDVLPLLADTIGLCASPQEVSEAPASSLISCSSTPVFGSAPVADRYSAPFSCVVIDLETTGFSATADEILEVGCVELRWTPLSRTTSAGSKYAAPCAPSLDEHSDSSMLEGLWTRGERVFHRYVRPSSHRRISAAATAVHGITWETVRDCAPWPVVASELAAYLALIVTDTLGPTPTPPETAQPAMQRDLHFPPLVAHNALFDARFLEQHLRRCGYRVLWHPLYPLTCTRQWAHVAYPHLASSLDALCKFLSVDGAADRAVNRHGALTDATLTALLFLRMCRLWTERFSGGG
ncbi:hypothetical protein LSCM1_01931 [Leishmania martiniquensis]|uniref:Exonuclease domain-containing protein n=1 Tax=Leishmania martiniquensis TaxID=1580590 RepID=A0A836GRV6_9TRYP|nr:hypothetical protein LSCM1_01931 [Leishmania martiniquensis]